MRRATDVVIRFFQPLQISIHALLAESDQRSKKLLRQCIQISIHALLAESDVNPLWLMGYNVEFLSTLSLRRATDRLQFIRYIIKFLSTLSLRRATLAGPSGPAFLYNFYPRSPCGERRRSFNVSRNRSAFLSTLSLRRATRGKQPSSGLNIHFYPRSPCGERRRRPTFFWQPESFLSTLSLRRATGVTVLGIQHKVGISIHALLAESDTPNTFRHCTTYLFLSTLSLRRATPL